MNRALTIRNTCNATTWLRSVIVRVVILRVVILRVVNVCVVNVRRVIFRVVGFTLAVIWLGANPSTTNSQEQSNRPEDRAAREPEMQADDLPKTAIMRLTKHSENDEWNGVYLMQFSGDGKYLAARTRDHVVHIYELDSQQLKTRLDGHEGFVKAMQFANDDQRILTAASGDEESVKVWNFKTGEELARIPGGGEFLEISKTNEVVIVDELERRVADMTTGDIVEMKHLRLPGEQVLGVAPGSETFAVFRSSSRRQGFFPIRIVNRANKDTMQLAGINARPKRVTFSNNGQFAAAVYRAENSAYFWSLENPARKFAMSGHDDRVETLCFSHDNRFVATASWDHSIMIWDVISGTPLTTLEGHQGHVCSIAFSNDGRRLASGSTSDDDFSILIWDLNQNLYREANEVRRQTFEQPEKLWELLGDENAKIAMGAVDVLVEQFERRVSMVEQNVAQLLNVTDSVKIQELIDQLDDVQFDKRQEAYDRLMEIRPAAESLLHQNLKTTNSAEIRSRITKILKHPFKRPKIAEDQRRRLLRLVHTLERVQNETSHALLGKISLGHNHVDISRAATEALERTKQSRPAEN